MSPAESLKYFKPELIMTGSLLLIIIVSLWKNYKERRLTLTLIAFAGLVFTSYVLIQSAGDNILIFHNLYACDPFSRFFKMIFLLCGGFIVLIVFQAREIKEKHLGEFYAILFSLILGMFLLVSSSNLLMIYLSLEFVSITSYILTGFNRSDRRSSEAALKYVIYGGVVSGIMLFGMSYFYGLFGTLEIPAIKKGLIAALSTPYEASRPGSAQAMRLTVLAASIFIFSGFGYKMAAVPFHMWCPDVYEGAPTPFTAFLSIAPKIAGLAAFCRFLLSGFFENLSNFLPVTEIPWAAILGILAAATMTLGNLSAISQNNVKRLLAYSGVAHCGYILMGLSALSREGLFAFYFYAVVYLFMNLGAFVIVIVIREKTGQENIEAYRGLGVREPFIAVSFAVFLFSLTGIPPLAGFIGKFYLFAAVIHKAQAWYYLLAIIGILNSVISLYYYARIIKAMFIEKAADAQPLQIFSLQKLIMFVLLIPIFIFGIYWQPLAKVATFLF
ncbi:MAG: NADH-quinone oxidoreductase subunit N [Pseudomonadota bacterium]